MNDNFAQQAAQTPSPSTGSRHDTHRVGSAISSVSRTARARTLWPVASAPRQDAEKDLTGVLPASMPGG